MSLSQFQSGSGNSAGAGLWANLKSKPWFVPVVVVILVATIGWIILTSVRGEPTIILDSPRDRLVQEITAKLRQDDRFTNVVCFPSSEDSNTVIVSGEVEYIEDEEAAAALVASIPTNFKIEVHVEAQPNQ